MESFKFDSVYEKILVFKVILNGYINMQIKVFYYEQ